MTNDNGQIITPLLLSAGDAPRVLGIGKTLFLQLDDTGTVPQAIKLGNKRKLWRYDELRAWIIAGCPQRDRWNYSGEISKWKK